MNRATLLLMVWLVGVLAPAPIQHIGSLGVRALDATTVGVLFLFVIVSFPGFSWRLIGNSALWLSFAAIVAFATLRSDLLFLFPISYRDFFEVGRYVSFIVILAAGYTAAHSSNFDLRKLRIISYLLCLFCLVFLIAQKLIPDQVAVLTDIYAPEHQARRVGSTGRPTSIFGNPNSLGVGLLLLLCLQLSDLKFGGLELKIKITLFSLLIFSVLGIVLTGSSTSFVVLIIVLLAWLFSISKMTFIIVIGASSFTLLAYPSVIAEFIYSISPYMASRLSPIVSLSFYEFATEYNFADRAGRWSEAVQLLKDNPLLGIGSARSSVGTSTDSIYFYILMRYGSIGLSLYVLWVVSVVYYCWRAVRFGTQTTRVIGMSNFLQLIVILVSGIMIDSQFVPKLMLIHIFFVGLLLGSIQKSSRKVRAVSLSGTATKRDHIQSYNSIRSS